MQPRPTAVACMPDEPSGRVGTFESFDILTAFQISNFRGVSVLQVLAYRCSVCGPISIRRSGRRRGHGNDNKPPPDDLPGCREWQGGPAWLRGPRRKIVLRGLSVRSGRIDCHDASANALDGLATAYAQQEGALCVPIDAMVA